MYFMIGDIVALQVLNKMQLNFTIVKMLDFLYTALVIFVFLFVIFFSIKDLKELNKANSKKKKQKYKRMIKIRLVGGIVLIVLPWVLLFLFRIGIDSVINIFS